MLESRQHDGQQPGTDAMKIGDVQLVHWATVVGAEWLRENETGWRSWVTDRLAWFTQLEDDLAIVAAQVGEKRIRHSYRQMLRDRRGVQKAIFETITPHSSPAQDGC